MRDDTRRRMPAELVLMEQRHAHSAKAAGLVGAGWVDWEPSSPAARRVDWEPSSPAARRPSLHLRFRPPLWTPLWTRLLVVGRARRRPADKTSSGQHLP